MAIHDELDQLSAYLDGALSEADEARVRAHLPRCAECRETLRALEATVADLRALPEPAPDPQTSWAIRTAVRRTDRARRASRWMPAVAAAAVAAIAVIVVVGSERPGEVTLDVTGETVLASGVDYDKASAEARVAALAAQLRGAYQTGPVAEDADAAAAVSGAPGAAAGSGGSTEAAPAEGGDTPETQVAPAVGMAPAPLAPQRSAGGPLERCVEQIRKDADVPLRPVLFELASYEGRPAFLLAFAAPATSPQRIELWVMSADQCEVLLFVQRRLR